MKILRITVTAYRDGEEIELATYWWSPARGVTCTDLDQLAAMYRDGIASPPAGELVYPHDGEAFMAALQARYRDPVVGIANIAEADVQGGGSLENPPAPDHRSFIERYTSTAS